MEMMMDIISELQEDHRRVESLYHRFTAAEPEQRGEILQELVRELSVHSVVEEQVVYPSMREHLENGDEIVDHAIEEHDQAKEILAELDKADPTDEATFTQVRELMRSVTAHVTEEEEQFNHFRIAIGPAALTELSEKAAEAREEAPSRPHPNAPSGGAAGAVAGAVASVVDKARDAVSRR